MIASYLRATFFTKLEFLCILKLHKPVPDFLINPRRYASERDSTKYIFASERRQNSNIESVISVEKDS